MTQALEHSIQAIGKLHEMPIDNLKSHITAHLCSLTGSTIAFFGTMNPAEDVMTIVGFSSGAMVGCRMVDKPIVYPVKDVGLWGDPIRERKALIINDYDGLIRPTKRGHPEGHVKVRRFVGVPVWEGKKIVMLVGLGNKKEEYTAEDVKNVEAFMASVWPMIKGKS